MEERGIIGRSACTPTSGLASGRAGRWRGGVRGTGLQGPERGVQGAGTAGPASYCIIDTSQIMHIEHSEMASCTFPATKPGPWGRGSLVGLAATAWSLIADAALCDHSTRALSYLAEERTQRGRPVVYAVPEKMDDLVEWCRSGFNDVCPGISTLLQQMIRAYSVSFRAGSRRRRRSRPLLMRQRSTQRRGRRGRQPAQALFAGEVEQYMIVVGVTRKYLFKKKTAW